MESSKTARGLSTAHRGCDAISRASSSRRVSSSTAESFLGHRRCAVTTNELNTGLWSLCVSARVEPYDVRDTSRPRHNTRSHHAACVSSSPPSRSPRARSVLRAVARLVGVARAEYVCVPGGTCTGANATGASVQPANALPAARSSDSWSAPSSGRTASRALRRARSARGNLARGLRSPRARRVAIAESRPRTWSSARFRR